MKNLKISWKNSALRRAVPGTESRHIPAGNPDNLKEELGDLLLQVVMHARIAEEEGYFTMDDVIQGIIDKMVRRHPHVFGDAVVSDSGEVLTKWDEIKKWEKEGKEWTEAYLPAAFDEAKKLIDEAAERKGFV